MIYLPMLLAVTAGLQFKVTGLGTAILISLAKLFVERQLGKDLYIQGTTQKNKAGMCSELPLKTKTAKEQ